MDAIAPLDRTSLALTPLMSRIAGALEAHGAHPARTVVLMPFRQLLPAARAAWGALRPQGFAPRIETSGSWCEAFDVEPVADGFTGELARDLLTARSLLERAGLGDDADLLAPRLCDAARQLQSAAAAVRPDERRGWAARARHAASAFDTPVLAHEGAVATIAIEWVAASGFATDALFDATRSLDLVVAVQGLRDDPLTLALAAQCGERGETMRLPLEGEPGRIALHEARDPADEAARAAACVLRHVRDGRSPVALAAIDRALTRRIRALLEQANAAIRDETGWKLSTTRAGADVMLALRACMHGAGTDGVIDWLKNSPAHPPGSVLALERRVRRAGVREWRFVRPADLGEGREALLVMVNACRDAMQSPRPLAQWLTQLRAILDDSGQWRALERDAAGQQVIAALRLADWGRAELEGFAPARRRLSLSEFSAWVNDVLEAENFRPPAAEEAQVVILPLAPMLARGFAAAVLPGCDEAGLPASPDPDGVWTPGQRELLGLPSREALATEQRDAWRAALRTPHCDVLWRVADDSGEPVLASPLVQQLQAEGLGEHGDDPRETREVPALPTGRPAAIGRLLTIETLSASAYDDLRKCPYRFFATRQLRLQEPDEIDQDLDKRDFGNWLHRVLNAFHTQLAGGARTGRRELLDECAQQVTREMRLDEGEFLPFRAAWLQAREGYLAWLEGHEQAEGAQFQSSETEHERELAGIRLFGRVDRIDRLRGGGRMVMDYKTENLTATQNRVKQPGEDTQLAFYAALLQEEPLRAAYINIGERGETKTVEQEEIAAARDMLLEGIVHDFARIADGAVLPALGEGVACEWCAARGLCRKDFWS